jgi:hypothetical protein
VLSGQRSGRGKPWKDRTHCLRGHEYTASNILWRSDGRSSGARRCRKCKAAASARWYATRGAAARSARRKGKAKGLAT